MGLILLIMGIMVLWIAYIAITTILLPKEIYFGVKGVHNFSYKRHRRIKSRKVL